MRRRRINHQTARTVAGFLVAGAFLGGLGSFVHELAANADTPAPPAPVTVQVTGPDYAGYAVAIEGLGVSQELASPEFVDNLCPNLASMPDNPKGVVYGQVRGWAPESPITFDDEALLLAIAGDAKAFVCYR